MRRYRSLFLAGAAVALAAFLAGPAAAALTFNPDAPANVRVGTAITPIAVSTDIAGGSLEVTVTGPAGIEYTAIDDASGAVAGTPTAAGAVTITATEFAPPVGEEDPVPGDTETRSFTVFAVPAIGAGQSLPGARVGVEYPPFNLAGLDSNVPDASASWSVQSGLPAGLTEAGGTISGTPAPGSAGNYQVMVTVTDNRAPAATSPSTMVTLEVGEAVTVFGNDGTIVYTRGTVRDAATGEVTATGNLFALNLATREETQLTQYADPGVGEVRVILNPVFTPDGEQVLYTARIGADATARFRVYLVALDEVAAGADNRVLLREDGVELRYAALSPDYNGEGAGKLAYTRDAAGRRELWVYDFQTDQRSQIRSEAGLKISHPVFVGLNTIAYLGEKNGVQNIYTISDIGQNSNQLTANADSLVQYGRLAASARGTAASVWLTYGKRTHGGFSWRRWNVYALNSATGAEVQLTDTVYDEQAAAFYGDAQSLPPLEDTGLVLYEADLLAGGVGLWQANFDLVNPAAGNTAKIEQVAGGTGAGQVAWGPVEAAEYAAPSVSIGESRIYFIDSNQVAKADTADGAAWTTTVFNTGLPGPERNPALAGTGGTILFEGDGREIYYATHDGAVVTDIDWAALFVAAGSSFGPGQEFEAVAQPSLSPCGRFALFLALVNPGDEAGQIWVLQPNAANAPPTIAPLVAVPDAQDASFNPDMTQVAYRRTGVLPGTEGIWSLRVHTDHLAGTIGAATVGVTSIRLTRTSANVNNRQPAFSPDGYYIVFVSDRLSPNGDTYGDLFAMEAARGEADGRSARLLLQGGGQHNPAYGPVNDDPGFYHLAWVQGGQIYTGRVARRDPRGIADVQATGLTPTPDSPRFTWGRARETGSVFVQRDLQKVVPGGSTVTYRLTVDVDEAAVATGFTINEQMPLAWNVTIADIRINGVAPAGNYANLVANDDGVTRSLRLVFSNNPGMPAQHKVADAVITVPVTIGTAGVLGGRVSYSVAGQNQADPVYGNGRVRVGNPPLPVDLFDADGRRWRDEEREDGSEKKHVVDDFDLLFAIDAWALDAQLSGYGARWPADINSWDNIILAVIDIWASTRARGWAATAAGGVGEEEVPAGRAATVPGEYLYVPSYTAVAGMVFQFGDGGGATIAPEMFWTQGRWNP